MHMERCVRVGVQRSLARHLQVGGWQHLRSFSSAAASRGTGREKNAAVQVDAGGGVKSGPGLSRINMDAVRKAQLHVAEMHLIFAVV